MWEHNEKIAVYELERRLSRDTEYVSVLILDFLVSKTVRNKFPSFTSHPICFVMAAQMDKYTSLFLFGLLKLITSLWTNTLRGNMAASWKQDSKGWWLTQGVASGERPDIKNKREIIRLSGHGKIAKFVILQFCYQFTKVIVPTVTKCLH